MVINPDSVEYNSIKYSELICISNFDVSMGVQIVVYIDNIFHQ